MTNDISPSAAVKPYWRTCTCPTCVSTREADALAARLGMAGPIDPPCPCLCLCGAVPCQSAWAGPLPSEGVPPAEWEAEGPTERDDAWRLETFAMEGGCREWDLSPEEQEIELYGETAWKRAVREMEETEAERRYDRMVEMWGPAGRAVVIGGEGPAHPGPATGGGSTTMRRPKALTGLAGELTITRPMGGDGPKEVRMVVEDVRSGCVVLELRLPLEDFADALFGSGHVPCRMEVNTSGTVGRECQRKYVDVFVPDGDYKKRDDVAAKALGPHEIDGWRGHVNDATNPHRWVRTGEVRDGIKGDIYRVGFTRWVDDDGNPVELGDR